MAVVSMMRMSGDTDELLAKLGPIMDLGRGLAPKHGGLGSLVARTDDGILAINLWEHEEGRQAMAEEPAILEALASAGLPAPSFEGYEVLWMAVRPEAVREG
jgi:hypothetical protein